MSSLNKVILLGNLTRDPEIRETPNGSQVAECGMALNRKFKNASGELIEEVTYVDVTFWGNQAKLVRDYCHKGKQIAIEGRLKLDQWESKEGEKRSKLRVIAENLHFTGSRGDQEQSGQQAGMPAASTKQQQPRKMDEWGDPVPQSRQAADDDNLPGLHRGAAPRPAGESVPF